MAVVEGEKYLAKCELWEKDGLEALHHSFHLLLCLVASLSSSLSAANHQQLMVD